MSISLYFKTATVYSQMELLLNISNYYLLPLLSPSVSTRNRDILPRPKSWASSLYFKAYSSCFFHRHLQGLMRCLLSDKEVIGLYTGVNSAVSQRTEMKICETVHETFQRLSESVAIPIFERWVFWRQCYTPTVTRSRSTFF